MAKINVAEEIVKNHSTEEVVEYIASTLRRIVATKEKEEFGASMSKVEDVAMVANELNHKLNSISPSVG